MKGEELNSLHSVSIMYLYINAIFEPWFYTDLPSIAEKVKLLSR